MKYSISRDQHFFFEKHHFIEFDDLLTAEEHSKLVKGIAKPGTVLRDLSYFSESVKSVTHLPRLAKLASELSRKRPLRFGFDQLLRPPFTISNLYNEVCIRGLVMALFLSVDDKGGKKSHGIFAEPVCDLALLPLNREEEYIVIGWAEEKALYVLQPNDAYTHELKKQGYVFGDRLTEKWHPILTR